MISLSSQLPKALNMAFFRELLYFQNTTVHFDRCTSKRSMDWLHFNFPSVFLGIWLPMLIIIICHIVMFCKLQKEAIARRRHAISINTNQQMQRISKAFLVVVCAFFVCLIPQSVLSCFEKEVRTNAHLVNLWNVSIPLANVNSCLNPCIYGKIHLKIYLGVRWVFKEIQQSVRLRNVCVLFRRDRTVKHEASLGKVTPNTSFAVITADIDVHFDGHVTNRNIMQENQDTNYKGINNSYNYGYGSGDFAFTIKTK